MIASPPAGTVGPRVARPETSEARAAGPGATRLVVGIGELAVSNRPGDVIVTHALGSCVAVCLWDPTAGVAGLLHFLLPDSRINPQRATDQPAAFADTGIPLLFQTAYAYGLHKNRCIVRLVGGAEIATSGATFDIGKRNVLSAKNLLWRNGVLINAEAVGGRAARTVNLFVANGRLVVSAGTDRTEEL